MPRAGRTRRQRQEIVDERARREQAENEAASLRIQLQRRGAHNAAPLFRSKTLQWDWNCGCGHYVYAGKRNCPKCFLPRHYGATVPGVIRGISQSGQAASTAITAQRRVPQSEPTRVVQQTRVLQSPTRRVAQPQQAAAPAKPAGPKPGGGVQGPSPATQQETGSSSRQSLSVHAPVNQIFANDEQAQMEEEQDDGVVDTEPERPLNEPWAIQNKLRNLERGRQRKQARLEKEETAIQDQTDFIAAQQEKLVELQAKAVSTAEEIRSIDAVYSENMELLAKVTAERSATEAAASPKQEQQGDRAKEARDLLTTALRGVQTYKDQPPELQALLTQFIGCIEAMQRSELNTSAQLQPGQTTLQQAFAKQPTPPATLPATGSTARFEIHSGEATPTEALGQSVKAPPEQAAEMWVDTQVAQKRKIDAASPSAQCSTATGAPPGPQPPAQADVQQPLQPNLGTPMEPLVSPATQYKPVSRDAFLADLRSKVDRDAIRAGKKERDLQYNRSSPY